MKNKLFIGTVKGYEYLNSQNTCYVQLSLENGNFSACGEIWQHNKRDIISGGQNLDELLHLFPNNKTMQKVHALWKRWHLNDMRAGCKHQSNLDTSEEVEVVKYGLTSEAYQMREAAIKRAAMLMASHKPSNLTTMEESLILLENWFENVSSPPDADSPLSGCYEVKKREIKSVGWVKPSEHPKGLLCKPCAVCGYKYGSAWLKEELPEDVQKEIADLIGKPEERTYDMYGRSLNK